LAKAGFTVKTIEALKPRGEPYELRDDAEPGLYVVVFPSGARSFVWRYRFHNRSKKLTLGPVSLAEARRRAQEARHLRDDGIDPSAAKQETKAAKKAAHEAKLAAKDSKAQPQTPPDDVGHVISQFIERYAKPNTRDWRETERLLKRNVETVWPGRRLSEISRADVHALLDGMRDRGAAVSANRTFAQLRKLCGWAIERGLIEQNPCAGIRKPTAETPRDRTLSISELRRVIAAARTLGWPFGPIVELLALTGQRRDEIGGMTWTEINQSERAWTLPAARAKNRREHTLPLAPRVVEIIESVPRFEESPFLFSAGKNPPSGWSVAKRRLELALAADGGALAPWVLHDLRRSVASGMASIGVPLQVVERILNHVSGSFGGVVGVYQRYSYADEMREALEKWATKLFVATES
jgi:integrase